MKKNNFYLFAIAMATMLCAGFASCGSDDDDDDKPLSVNPSSVSMKYDESQQLSASGATSWRSENEFVATVDQNGLLKGNHVGSTDIIVTDGKATGKCNVTITPKYAFFDVPVLSWGATMSDVRRAETHGTPETTETALIYKYDNRSLPAVVMYSFKNGGLNSVIQLTGSSYFSNAGLFLIERFQPYGETDGLYIFGDAMIHTAAKTIVGLDYMTLSSTKYAGITYMKNTSTSSISQRRYTSDLPTKVHEIIDKMLVR